MMGAVAAALNARGNAKAQQRIRFAKRLPPAARRAAEDPGDHEFR
jgi:hypothetical protein